MIWEPCKCGNQQSVYVLVDIEGEAGGRVSEGGGVMVPPYSIVTLKVMFDCFCIIRYEE